MLTSILNRTAIAAALIGVCLAETGLRAADTSTAPSTPAPVNLTYIAAKLSTYLQSIQGVEYKSATGNPDHPISTLHWEEKGNMVSYEWVQSHPHMAQNQAFDGQHYQQLNPDGGTLYISQTPIVTRGSYLRNEVYLTTPFEWVLPKTLDNIDRQIKLADLQPDRIFNALKAATNITQTTRNSQPVVQMTLPGGVDWYYKQPYTYRVYFAVNEGYYPIGWEKLGADGKVQSMYHVIELGQVKLGNLVTINYPKTVSASYFAPEDTFDTSNWGRPHVRVTSITFNEAKDEDFTIDPSTSTGIYDCDAKKLIPVPK